MKICYKSNFSQMQFTLALCALIFLCPFQKDEGFTIFFPAMNLHNALHGLVALCGRWIYQYV